MRTFIKGPQNEKNNKKYLNNYYHEVVLQIFFRKIFQNFKRKNYSKI